jgi:peptide/nickel transport system permease protein
MQDYFWHLLLPSISLIVISFAGYSRYERASMLDNLGSDYVRTARAKGLPERRVIFRHAFRNSLIPLTTVVALDFAAIIGGAIITERVFGWKGMGSFFIEGLTNADPNPVLAFVMVTAIAVVVFNIIADVLYAWLDPRIRVG